MTSSLSSKIIFTREPSVKAVGKAGGQIIYHDFHLLAESLMRVEIYIAEDFREHYLIRLQAVDFYIGSVNQEFFRFYLVPVHKYLQRLNVNNNVLVSHPDAHFLFSSVVSTTSLILWKIAVPGVNSIISLGLFRFQVRGFFVNLQGEVRLSKDLKVVIYVYQDLSLAKVFQANPLVF